MLRMEEPRTKFRQFWCSSRDRGWLPTAGVLLFLVIQIYFFVALRHPSLDDAVEYFDSEEPLDVGAIVARNRELLGDYEIPMNNTFRPLVYGEHSEYALDLQAMLPFLSRAHFLERVRNFADGTRGLLADEISRARAYGFCKEPQKIVARFELGYTLEGYAMPSAYFAHLHGCLESTSAYKGSLPFYFFNPEHQVHDLPVEFPLKNMNVYHSADPWRNTWDNLTQESQESSFNIYRTRYPARYGVMWPPFKKFYASEMFRKIGPTSKHISIVGGKHTTEWSQPPANTFAKPDELQPIIEAFVDTNHFVIYNRAVRIFPGDAKQDIEDPGDHEFLREEYPGQVAILSDILDVVKPLVDYDDATELWNILQLMVYSHGKVFVGTQGGGSVIMSMFGGSLFILHRAGSECLTYHDPPVPNDYIYQWWGRHGGSKISAFGFHSDLYRDLRTHLVQTTVAEDPLGVHDFVATH